MSTLFSHFFTKINQISPLEHNFTEVLEPIALKPKTLYFYGEMPQNVSKNGKKSRSKTVAIVGSRHNTRYGQEIAHNLAYELAKRGVVIVSGLAYGIDTIAHRGCLEAGGVTIAVLGTRIDRIYPKPHLDVACQILKNKGAIISEYAPSSLAEAELSPGEYLDERGNRQIKHQASFLYRNRIISGLSDVVVVVEAAEKSGSLNTATHAIEQGKTVFAVPGNITNPYSQGCNKLIRQGAIPYTSPDDVLLELFPEEFVKAKSFKRVITGDTDVETLILRSVDGGLRSGEEIMAQTHLPPEVFNQATTILEIKGRLRPLGMNNWSLA